MKKLLTILLIGLIALSGASFAFADDSTDLLSEELLQKGLIDIIGTDEGGEALCVPDKEAIARELLSMLGSRTNAADLKQVFSALPGWASSLAGTVCADGLSIGGLAPAAASLENGAEPGRFLDLLSAMGFTVKSGMVWTAVDDEPQDQPRLTQLAYTPAEETTAPEEVPEADPDQAVSAPDIVYEADPYVQAEEIIACAEKYLGVPYSFGGKTPKAFDCSGYLIYVFHECGYEFTAASCQDLYRMSDKVGKDELQRGDLVFFKGTYETSAISHVGIYLGDGQMIHAGSKGVCYTDLSLNYWKSHFYGYGRFSPEG